MKRVTYLFLVKLNEAPCNINFSISFTFRATVVLLVKKEKLVIMAQLVILVILVNLEKLDYKYVYSQHSFHHQNNRYCF